MKWDVFWNINYPHELRNSSRSQTLVTIFYKNAQYLNTTTFFFYLFQLFNKINYLYFSHISNNQFRFGQLILSSQRLLSARLLLFWDPLGKLDKMHLCNLFFIKMTNQFLQNFFMEQCVIIKVHKEARRVFIFVFLPDYCHKMMIHHLCRLKKKSSQSKYSIERNDQN